jgi:coenzyme F420-reducing hydrogenase alpha subunit
MGKTSSIAVHHVTRVEGHGNIVIDLRDGRLTRCDLEIVESPRFFEVLLKDRPYEEAPRITCRICGICSVGHATASVHAIEAALGVKPGPRTRGLRRLNMCGEWLQSHILHAYFLVAPDAFGASSVIPLAGDHPDVITRALRLKRLANEICYTVSGRHVMPISYQAGGMSYWPALGELEAMRAKLEAARPDIDATVDLFATLTWPQAERAVECLAALDDDGAYPMMGGTLHSSTGKTFPPRSYRDAMHEYLVEHSASKHVKGQDGTLRVGALPRFNLAYDRLHPRAQLAAKKLNLAPGLTNPFLYTAAQVVEAVQAFEEAVVLTDALLVDPSPEDRAPIAHPRGGDGVGVCEVPRGTLIHDYDIGADGRIIRANCIIPTGQNLASIEEDMRAFIPAIMEKPKAEITHFAEMLVRAYDPCISCSVHVLDVEFEGERVRGQT